MYLEWTMGLSEDDKAQVLAILNAVASREGTNGIPRPLTEEEGAEYMDALDDSIRRGNCYQLLARDEKDNRIIAIATLERVKMNPARAHVADLKRMASLPERRGFANNFLLEGWRAVLDKCREIGCDIVNIDVSEDGPYRLWEKLGFRVWAKIEDYARVGERRLDGYFLSVYLDEAYAVLDRFDRNARVQQKETSSPVSQVQV